MSWYKGDAILQNFQVARLVIHVLSININIAFKAKKLSQLKGRTRDKQDIFDLSVYPRSSDVAAFAAMQDCLYANLHRFQIVDNPACPSRPASAVAMVQNEHWASSRLLRAISEPVA
ncbi:hypothetical protein TNCV_4495891 [Trichonephila clavipes]|nr:hypothetical protein TNCV_4495891 [Trichonephila clavipes]